MAIDMTVSVIVITKSTNRMVPSQAVEANLLFSVVFPKVNPDVTKTQATFAKAFRMRVKVYWVASLSVSLSRMAPPGRTNCAARWKRIWEGSFDYITDPAGRLESREAQGASRGELQNGDRWTTEFSRLYEFLENPFPLRPGSSRRPEGTVSTNSVRPIFLLRTIKASGDVDFSHGSCYDGDRTQVGYTGRLDLGPRLGIEPRVSINWVDVPVGRFMTKLTSAMVGLTMTPRMAVTGLVQFNSSVSALTSNIRFRWGYQPGSDLFIVYSDGRNMSLTGFPTLA